MRLLIFFILISILSIFIILNTSLRGETVKVIRKFVNFFDFLFANNVVFSVTTTTDPPCNIFRDGEGYASCRADCCPAGRIGYLGRYQCKSNEYCCRTVNCVTTTPRPQTTTPRPQTTTTDPPCNIFRDGEGYASCRADCCP
ncbi:MAG: hypothetical protein NZ893_02120, partial [Candidatus Aenigmarchaeota archaeon]|nr:hypothetical protein [Candidatus Aenigmarchaeota archaeon]